MLMISRWGDNPGLFCELNIITGAVSKGSWRIRISDNRSKRFE